MFGWHKKVKKPTVFLLLPVSNFPKNWKNMFWRILPEFLKLIFNYLKAKRGEYW